MDVDDVIKFVRNEMLQVQQSSQLRLISINSPCLTCKYKHCCKRRAQASVIEAMAIYTSLSNEEKRLIDNTLKRYEKYTNLNQIQWFMSEIECPLFHDGKCISKYKPILCSIHNVLSPPQSCSPSGVSEYKPNDFGDIANKAYESLAQIVNDKILITPISIDEALRMVKKFMV